MDDRKKLERAGNLVGDVTEVLRALEYCLSLFWDELQCPETLAIRDTRSMTWLVSDELESCTRRLDKAYDLIDRAKDGL